MSSSIPSVALPNLSDFPLDNLSLLELLIARRADELSRSPGCGPERDFWIQAEREVLGSELNALAAS